MDELRQQLHKKIQWLDLQLYKARAARSWDDEKVYRGYRNALKWVMTILDRMVEVID